MRFWIDEPAMDYALTSTKPVRHKGADGQWHLRAENDESAPCHLPAMVLVRPDRPVQPTVQPSVDLVARALFLQRYPGSGGWDGPGWEKRRGPWMKAAEAVLALIGGRTEQEVIDSFLTRLWSHWKDLGDWAASNAQKPRCLCGYEGTPEECATDRGEQP